MNKHAFIKKARALLSIAVLVMAISGAVSASNLRDLEVPVEF